MAPRLGDDMPAAFTAGLLHDIGLPLLFRADPEAYATLPAETSSEPAELRAREIALFGIDHCEAAAVVLKAWKLPTDIVTAVANHHNLTSASEPLTRATVAATLLAELAVGRDETPPQHVLSVLLQAASITEADLPGVVTAVRERAAKLEQLTDL
jgi:putative nucleotidyltransferase with HDIG domain